MATKAYQGPVELNGIRYPTRGPVLRAQLDEWPEASPQTSERSRPARRFLQSLEHGFKGLLVDRDYAGATGLFYDSTVETRWGHPTLSGLWVADTAWAPHHISGANATDFDIIGGLNFDSECWVFHGQTVTGVYKMYARRYSETNEDWDVVEEIATNGTARVYNPLAACVGGNKMYCLYADSTLAAFVLEVRSQGSSIWSPAAMTGGPTYAGAHRYKMMVLGNRLYLTAWNNSTGVVSMYYSTDDGENFTAGATTVTSKYQPTSFVAFGDPDGIMIPHLGTAEGVWYYDLNGANPYKILDLTLNTDQWNCMGMAMWETTAELMIPLGGYPLGQLKAMGYQGRTRQVRDVGLNLGAGLPVARQGRIIQVLPTPQFLYVLTRNTGNTEAGIFVLEFNWHHSFDSDRSGAAGIGWPTTGTPKSQLIAISNVDSTQRLHVIWDNGTNADGAHTKWPLQDPTTVSSFATEASGILDMPYYAGGLPEIPGLWLQGHVDAASLSAANTGEYIKWTFGADSVARTTTTPGGSGEFLSATKTLGFASTNAGISAKNMGHRLVLHRDATDTTHTPILYSFVTEFLKLPTPRHVWRFFVDLDEINEDTTRDKELAITNLRAVETSTTQVTFSCGGETQVYVKLLPPSPQFGLVVPREDTLETLDRTGTVEIIAVELI